jgi:hypothetical protein
MQMSKSKARKKAAERVGGNSLVIVGPGAGGDHPSSPRGTFCVSRSGAG